MGSNQKPKQYNVFCAECIRLGAILGEKNEKSSKIIAIFELLCLASLREKAERINGEP